MGSPEETNDITRNFYQWDALKKSNRVVEEIFNNEICSDGNPGIQAAIREILHKYQSAFILLGGDNCAPTGTAGACNVAGGYIFTKNSSGLSRKVTMSAATALNIDATTKCAVASNDGTFSVKNITSVLSTDVIIAIRGADGTLVDVRNIKTEDDILAMNAADIIAGSSLKSYGTFESKGNAVVGGTLSVTGLTQISKIGTDATTTKCHVLKNGDSLSAIIDAMTSYSTCAIILLPGTYTGNITITKKNVYIYGTWNSIISGNITYTWDNYNHSILQGCRVNGILTISQNVHASSCLIYGGVVVSTGINASLIGNRIVPNGVTKAVDVDGNTRGCRIIGNDINCLGQTGVQYAVDLRGNSNVLNDNFISSPGYSSGGATYGVRVTCVLGVVNGNTLWNCQASGVVCYGIYVNGGAGSVISNNTIRDYDQGATTAVGIAFDVSCTITGNVLSNIIGTVTAYGIYKMANFVGGVIMGNTVSGITGTTNGIHTSTGTKAIVIGNNVVGEGYVTGTGDITTGNLLT